MGVGYVESELGNVNDYEVDRVLRRQRTDWIFV